MFQEISFFYPAPFTPQNFSFVSSPANPIAIDGPMANEKESSRVMVRHTEYQTRA
jgi:hypothetical protein